MPVFRLAADLAFPPPELANEYGLLAVGGDLAADRLLLAYAQGIFPWYNPGEPILWWSPDPRLVLYPRNIHVSRRLARTMRQLPFQITFDTAFEQVIAACASGHTRRHGGTWIGKEMIAAYCDLHRAGFAHSIEAWQNGHLAGGLYGVSLGRCFFGESMFTRTSNASKVALVTLAQLLEQWDFALIDCQVSSTHLERMGAREIPRQRFLRELAAALRYDHRSGKWDLHSDLAER
jgi:leucyl/phenylalanyl-tRNA--protein transferase